jgi:hypothetical protein
VTAAIRDRRAIKGWVCLRLPLFVLVALIILPRPAVGAEPLDSPNPLDRPMADLAILDGPDAAATPMLLVLDATSSRPSIARITILRREDAWVPTASADIDLGEDGLSARWLVGLDKDRFALVATSPRTAPGSGRAVIVGLDVRLQGDAATIDEGNRQVLDRAIENTGAADVDGFGSAELVLGLRPSFDSSSCGTSRLVVVDGSIGAVRRSIDIPGPHGAGLLGRFDAVPGADLLVYVTAGCPPGSDAVSSLLATRLADGAQSRAIDDELHVFPAALPPPLLLDLDGSAPDEVIATGAAGLAVFDPSHAWKSTLVAGGRSVPLLVGPTRQRGLPGTRVAILDTAGAGALVTLRLDRDQAGGVVLKGRSELADDAMEPARWSILESAIRAAGTHQVTSNAWIGDAVEPGCPFMVVPGAVLPCGTDTLRSGPAWLATRPLAAMPIRGGRVFLVAASLDWRAGTASPESPTPAAAGPAGWWRPGPSTPFALSEISSDDVLQFDDVPTPVATIESATTRDGTAAVRGPAGTRLFTSITPLRDGQVDPVAATDTPFSPWSWPGPGGRAVVVRVPVLPGLETGRDESVARLAIGDIERADGQEVSRWAMQVIPINDWGEWGQPVARTIRQDGVAPTVVVEEPFTSPIWPFSTHLAGRSEPGSTVRVDGFGELEVDPHGRFAIETRLAPWPQTFRVTTTDPAGNPTVGEFTIVGGIDYRRFPWPGIVTGALLASVTIRGLFDGRNRPAGHRTRASTDSLDDGSMPVIEELPPGRGLARG